jgi:hypothetical protein
VETELHGTEAFRDHSFNILDASLGIADLGSCRAVVRVRQSDKHRAEHMIETIV